MPHLVLWSAFSGNGTVKLRTPGFSNISTVVPMVKGCDF
jgi:hypothetical protein